MGGTRCQILTEISKEIWKYLLDHQTTITVEYLPGVLNIIAEEMSRSVKDLSKWMPNPKVFQMLCKARRIPCTYLFASRLTHQVTVYYAWKIDPYSRGQDAFQGEEKANRLITASRRDGTISHYQSVWNKWSSWCSRKQNDPVRGSINQVIEFLSDAFDEGLEFSTIAGYRSAISAYHDPIDGVVVGKYPLISSLMSGIHNKRFPQPKYTFIWDVEKVVSYLSSIDSENCTDKDLTLKLTMLLALTYAARAH